MRTKGQALRLALPSLFVSAPGEFVRREMGRADRREYLDHLLILSRHHLEYVLGEFVEHHEDARPHGEPAAAPLPVGRIVAEIALVDLSTNTNGQRHDPALVSFTPHPGFL